MFRLRVSCNGIKFRRNMEGFLFQDGIGLNLALKLSRRDIFPESCRERRKSRSKAFDVGVFFSDMFFFPVQVSKKSQID